METIAFIDTEINPKNGKILDIGGIKADGSQFRSCFISDFIKFLHGSRYVCGHNIFNHDLKYVQNAVDAVGLNDSNCIDTLVLSPLLFPAKPYHKLLKDDKLQPEELNNPLNDSIKARDLFFEEVAAFRKLKTNILFSIKGQKRILFFFPLRWVSRKRYEYRQVDPR